MFTTFAGLTLLLAVVIVAGRFRYGILQTVFILAAIAWGIYWIIRRNARARWAVVTAPGHEATTLEEPEDEEQE